MTAVTDAPDAAVYSLTNTASPTINDHGMSPTMASLPVHAIVASPRNPRRHFDEAALEELAASIREHGIIEPLIVQPRVRASGGGWVFVLIAGERRLRAATLAGLTHVPARIIDVDEHAAMKLRLVENLQRVDLDPIDEATGYRALHDVLGMTQTEIAKAVNRSQPSIANAMRVLDLPADVVERIRAGELTRGHGVALAKYKAFPRLIARLSTLAVAGWTVKRVEDPWSDYSLTTELTSGGVVKDLEWYGVAFDKAVCNACPFGAHFGHFCLKPEHYKQLQEEAEAGRKAKAEAAFAEVQAGNGSTPSIRDLSYGTYEHLASNKLPTGCGTGCACWRVARGYNDELTPICTDRARFDSLKVAQEQADKKARRQEHREITAAIKARVDGLDAIGDREIRLLAVHALLRCGAESAVQEARRHIPAGVIPAGVKSYELGRYVDQLTAVDAAALARYAIEAIVRQDLHERYDGYERAIPLTDWYLGQAERKGTGE